MKPIRLFSNRLLKLLPLLVAALIVSCEVQDFGEIIEDAGGDIRWYSVVQHAGVSLPLEIPADGTFTEPRNANMVTIVAVLPEPVDPASIGMTNIDFIGRDNAAAVRDPAFSVSMDATHTQVRVTVFGLSDIARYRIRLKNNSGVELGQRVFARLMGDVNGDETVTNLSDTDPIQTRAADSVDLNPADQLDIRSDVDGDYLHLNSDITLVTSSFGHTITATVPDFP
ncbi:MAG: hypothetical protein MUC76_10080 [Spirochaetes bacterium]|jgi:hypothetical protein|nr:hypothetical protein [Spirochaetota bacterium]